MAKASPTEGIQKSFQVGSLPIVNLTQLRECAKSLFKIGMPVLALGKPGTGKTEIGVQIAQELKCDRVFMWKPSHHDSIDFVGTPVPEVISGVKVTTFYQPQELLPALVSGETVMIIVDEITDAPVAVQNVLCGFIHERRILNWKVPEGCILHIYATGNRVRDRSGANKLETKLGNRIAIFEVEPTLDEFIDHTLQNNWDLSLVTFLKTRGNEPIDTGRPNLTFFNNFDPTTEAPVYATLRSWNRVSDLLKSAPSNSATLSMSISALVGNAPTQGYMAFKDVWGKMPNIDDLIANPDKYNPEGFDYQVQWAITISLISRANKVNIGNIITFLEKSNNEHSIFAMTWLFRNKVFDVMSPEWNAWLTRNHKVMKRVYDSAKGAAQ